MKSALKQLKGSSFRPFFPDRIRLFNTFQYIFPSGTACRSSLQPWKAVSEQCVKLSGNAQLTRLLQSEKAKGPINFTSD